MITPLFWLALALVSGIILAETIGGSPSAWLAASAAALLVALVVAIFRRKSRQAASPAQDPLFTPPPSLPASLMLPLLLAALCLGGARLRAQVPELNPAHIGWYASQGVDATVDGVVVAPPEPGDKYTRLLLETATIQIEGMDAPIPVAGLLQAALLPGDDWHYGDRLRLEGEISLPEITGDFNYRQYLQRRGIYAVVTWPQATWLAGDQGNRLLTWIYSLRERALSAVYRLYPDPAASLLAGILLGVDGNIPEDVQQAFRDTGTSHIIAISGFNIAILVALLASGLGRVLGPARTGQRRGAIAAILGICLYAVFVGGQASVVRAAIMGGMALLAVHLGRRQSGVNSLAVAAAVMAFFTPYILWDVGFLLSVTAMLGLILFSDPLTRAFKKLADRYLPEERARQLTQPVSAYFLVTLAAGLLTLPVLIYYFQRLSLISLLANPLVLPVQPALMVLGGLSLLAGMLWLPLGQLLAYLAWPLAAYTIAMVEFLGSFPLAAVDVGRVGFSFVIVFYVVLLGAVFGGSSLRIWLRARREQAQVRRPAWLPLAGLAVLLILAALIWQSALAAPDGRLHVTFLDAGSGEAILVRAPGGGSILINGGPSAVALSEALGRRLPLFDRRLDVLIVAGVGNAQLAALPENLPRFPPDYVLWSGVPDGSRSARLLHEQLTRIELPVHQAAPGQTIDLGKGAQLKVLAVSQQGAVLLVEWDNFRLLLPLGLDLSSMEALQKDTALSQVSAVLLADQGAAGVNPPDWLRRLNPQIAVISVSASDRRGLPDRETLDALQGYPLLRTDQNGWIEISTDGQQMWVEVERK